MRSPQWSPALPAGRSALVRVCREHSMSKRGRKKKSRKKSSANHGNRPNS
jgi:hypothetical protein